MHRVFKALPHKHGNILLSFARRFSRHAMALLHGDRKGRKSKGDSGGSGAFTRGNGSASAAENGTINVALVWNTDEPRLKGRGGKVDDDQNLAKMKMKTGSDKGLNGTRSAADVKSRDKEAGEKATVAFFRLFSFADKFDYLLMFVGTLGAAAHGSAIPVFLLFFGKLLNGLGGENAGNIASSTETVNKYSLYFLYLGLATLGSAWIEVSFWMLTGERQSAKIRTKYLEALLRQDVAYFDTDTKTGDFVSSIAADPLLVQDAISEKLGNFIHFMGYFFSGFIVGFSRQWRIALVTLAIVPLLAITGVGYAYTLARTSARAAIAYAEAGTIAEQAIAQVRTVYSFVSEAKFVKAYSASLEKTVKLGATAGLAKGIGMGCTYAVMYPCFALLLWYGGVLVRDGVVNGGEALTSVVAVVFAGHALGQALPNLTAFANGRAAAYKIFQMIDHDSKINVVNQKSEKLEKVEGQIEFRNVDFAYPARPDVFVFKKLSLVIPAGRTVAIVGSSGSGKSTVVSLIERFYDPIAGQVLLDGHDIKKLDLKWLRGRIGLVNQEPALFATTIAANILYGKDTATQKEIEEAAAAANAHSFIEKLPFGYETQVGERGIQLSGGQKQRVAIARAMLRNPAVLLLDEATSALDARSEQIVQEALDRLMVGRTTVVVAHRLSTIRNAESIAVVEQGQVVERGVHQDLISRPDGAYSTLVRLQELAAIKDGTINRNSFRTGHSLGLSARLSQRSWSFGGSFTAGGSFRESFSLKHGDCTKPLEKGEAGDDIIEKERESSKGSFTRLITMCQPEWNYGVGGIIASMLAGCQNPALALLIGEVLQAYYSSNEKMKTNVAKYAILLVGIGASSLLIYILQHYALGVVGENLVKRVRVRMFGNILRNELGWFDRDENTSGQILARLTSDATNVRAAIGDRIAMILQNVALVVVAWTMAFVLQWKLALVMISVTPLLVCASSTKRLFLKGFSGGRSKAYARATQVAGEAVTNIRTVAAFNAENKVQALFAEELKYSASKGFLTGQIAGFGLGLSQCLLFASYGLGLWYSGKLMADDGVEFGNVIKVFLILLVSSISMAETLALTPDIVKGGQAVASVFEVLDRKTAIEPEDPKGEHVERIAGAIEFKSVTFAYPSRPSAIIFKELNLKVPSGRSLALVGASGAGKSSVIALIERFYDPSSGQVLIDGKDIRNYNLKSVRQQIALVSQEPALFATTIYENILYGRDGASEAEVIEAAKVANAHSFISSLPDGFNTQAGEKGVQLSGGQKQRVAIARAVLKDPAILLLDEATSALDAESEKAVQEALDRLLKGRTTVMISHRLSTVRGADTIAVVQEGTILEEGSHTELLAKGGGYSHLVDIQNRVYQAQSANIERD